MAILLKDRLPELLALAKATTPWPIRVHEEELDEGEFVHVFEVFGMSPSHAASVERKLRTALLKRCWDENIVMSLCIDVFPRKRRSPRTSRAGRGRPGRRRREA